MTPFETQLLRHVLLGAAIGLPVAAAYFAALQQNVRVFVDGGSNLAGAGLLLLRLAAIGALFFGLSKVGLGALLGALASFVLVRSLVMRRVMRRA